MTIMNKTEKKFKENLSKILEMIGNNEPKVNICRFLNVKQSTLNGYLKKYEVVYTGNQSRKGIPHYEQITHYTEYTENGKNITASRLRQKLIKQGVKEKKCEVCGLDSWMDKPIPLELHHIDENRFNNQLENLQILCSNCHMQIHNYSNTKKLHKKDKIKKVKIKKERPRKVERPPHQKLIDEINQFGYRAIGRKYNVSDNAIRKWVKFYEKELLNTPLAE